MLIDILLSALDDDIDSTDDNTENTMNSPEVLETRAEYKKLHHKID